MELEAVVVTGSRIQGAAPVGATVTTLDRVEIENAGQVTLDRMIKELPQVLDLGFSETSRAQSAGNGNATWSSSINLRGLSPYATLIITDGHRMTSNGRAINPSVLPTLGVDRIEVIADGASAIYGSDAVAGVVNLIPRRTLDGAEAFSRYGSDSEGNFNEWNAGLAWGKVFDRGQVMLAYEHAFRSNLSGSDRAFFTSDQTARGGADYRTTQCSPGTLTYQGQSYALPAQFTAGNANTLLAGTSNKCDIQDGMDLFPQQKYDSVSSTATFEFLDGFEFIFDGYYNKREFTRQPGAITANLTVPATNAFFVAPSFYTTGSYTVAYNFQNDVPQNQLYGYQSNWQATPGFRIRLPHDWRFEGNYGFGKDTDRADAGSGLVTAALNTALASSDPATAFDPYGLGRTTDATKALIFDADATFPTNGELNTWQAGFNGPLFRLPGGEVKAAVGYEGQDFTMVLAAGTTDVRTYSRKVNSEYVELLLPIVGAANSRKGIQQLEMTAAMRLDDYSDVGSTSNPKFGVNYRPIDGLKLRASYGTSFRAPTFPEIFGNSTSIYIQPFQNPNAPPASIPGYKLGSGPNPDVGPETATTWTFGADIEPMVGLKFGITYFDINFKDTIANLLSNLSVLTQADEYAGTDVILFGQEAYDRIIELSTNGFAGTGPIAFRAGGAGYPPGAFDCANGINIPACVFVDGRSLNLGRTRMQGIDFDTRYRMQVGDGADSLTFQLTGTYLTAYDVAYTPGGSYSDQLNRIFQPLTFKGRASVSWDHGPINGRLMVSRVNGYDNDTVTPVQRVRPYMPVDLTFGWQLAQTFSMSHVNALTLGVELRNLFDTDPPFVNSRPGPNAGGGFDATVTNPVGMELAVSLRAKF